MARPSATKRLAALLVCALVMVVLASVARASTPLARLRVAPAVSALEVGEIVTLVVRVEDVTDLYGYQVYLDYDPAVLQLMPVNGQPRDRVAVTDLLDGFPIIQVDSGSGNIRVYLTQMHGAEPFAGSGILFSVQFRGQAPGSAEVAIATDDGETMLVNSEPMPIPYTARNANLYVGVHAPAPTGGRLCLPVVVGGAR